MAYRDKKKTFTLEHFTCYILMEDCTHKKAFWMKTTPNYKILLPRRITRVFKKKKNYILLLCLKKINFEWLNIFPNSLHLPVPTYALGFCLSRQMGWLWSGVIMKHHLAWSPWPRCSNTLPYVDSPSNPNSHCAPGIVRATPSGKPQRRKNTLENN